MVQLLKPWITEWNNIPKVGGVQTLEKVMYVNSSHVEGGISVHVYTEKLKSHVRCLK